MMRWRAAPQVMGDTQCRNRTPGPCNPTPTTQPHWPLTCRRLTADATPSAPMTSRALTARTGGPPALAAKRSTQPPPPEGPAPGATRSRPTRWWPPWISTSAGKGEVCE